jgi:hypothetical protein
MILLMYYLQGKNVLETPASNTEDFLPRDTLCPHLS